MTCRFCPFKALSVLRKRGAVPVRRSQDEQTRVLRDHCRSAHRRVFAEIAKALDKPSVWIDGPPRLRWSAR